MATKTLCFQNVALFVKVWRMAQAAPAAADEVTSVKNGKTTANNYFGFIPGITDNAVSAAAFIEGDADGAHGWRSELQYSGSFAAGNFTVSYKLKNRAAYAHAGRIYARVYRTTQADPTVAQLTKMNSANGFSAIISFSATAGEIQTGTFTINCDQNLTLANEYIFIIFDWLVTTAGGNVNAGVKFMVNEGAAEQVVTTDWTPAATTAYKDIATRFKLNVQSYKDIATRFKVWAQGYTDIAIRFKLTAQAFKDIGIRFKLTIQAFKDISTRLKITAQGYQDIATRFKLSAGTQAYKDIATRFRLIAQGYKDIATRFKLTVQNYQDIATRFRLWVQAYKDIATRFRLIAQGYKDIGTRFKLWVQTYQDISTRFKLTIQAYQDIATRFRLALPSYKDIATRFRLALRSYLDIGTRFKLSVPAYYKDVSTRFSLYQPDWYGLWLQEQITILEAEIAALKARRAFSV